jgi:hypothetical protein
LALVVKPWGCDPEVKSEPPPHASNITKTIEEIVPTFPADVQNARGVPQTPMQGGFMTIPKLMALGVKDG